MPRPSSSNHRWPLICALVALLALLFCPGCAGMMGPSPARVGCLNDCGAEKDTCMLNATSSTAIQECDAASRDCSSHCPR